MVTIYHLNNSRSERIVWLMEELDLPYELQTFQREPNMMAPQAYRDIHPLGHAPIIRDGETLMVESGAIIEYLLNRYGNGRLQPKTDSADFGRYLQWMHYAEGSAMSNLLLEYVGSMMKPEKSDQPGPLQMFHARNLEMVQALNDELGRFPYFAGAEFTAADIMMEFVFSFLERWRGEKLTAYPHAAAWLQRVHARPAYAKAMAVAGPKS
ncbi:MAG: gstA3 [Verrucomicrobiaceae bacterium]|nr:gstA3 [Verrucomicrobiaceae bacterium]